MSVLRCFAHGPEPVVYYDGPALPPSGWDEVRARHAAACHPYGIAHADGWPVSRYSAWRARQDSGDTTATSSQGSLWEPERDDATNA